MTTTTPTPPSIRAVPGVPVTTHLPRQLLRFAGVGVASTLAYLVLYLGLRTGVGPQAANLVALLVTAVGYTAANRAITFGVRGSDGAGRHQLQGLLVFAIGLALTSGALVILHAITSSPMRPLELAVLVTANLVATVVRFALFRSWVFARSARVRRGNS